MDDPPTHETMPESIDDCALQPTILGMRHERRQLLQALGAWLRRIDLAEFGEGPSGHGRLPSGDVATHQFQGLIGSDGR